jgi:hypothetical protein
MAQWDKVSNSGSNDNGWGIPKDDPHHKAWIESDSRVTVSYPACHWGWPHVTGGVEVSVEVHSDLQRSALPVGCLCP